MPVGMVEAWVENATTPAKRVRPRFFDNRRTSLLAQLPELVQEHASSSARNYLAMGSGFYESPTETNTIPSVLANIVRRLQDTDLLTGPGDRRVRKSTGVSGRGNLRVLLLCEGWAVRPPGKPDYFKGSRSLHAKFLFSAIERENSDLCNSAWLYLGSGNLTGPGFVNPMSAQGGNLEAGVVFTSEVAPVVRRQGSSTRGCSDECPAAPMGD